MDKNYTKEIIAGLIIGLVGGYYIKKWLQGKKNYVGIEDSGIQQVQFTITNQSDETQEINLFDSYINYSNPNVSITPSMQTFNTYLPVEPMKVESIQVQSYGKITPPAPIVEPTITPSVEPPITTPEIDLSKIPAGMSVEEYLKYAEAVGLTQSAAVPFNGYKNLSGSQLSAQANQQFTKTCTDASGNESKQGLVPVVSPYQPQSGISIIRPKDLILDGKCYLKYSVLPKEKLIITMNYNQYKYAAI